MLYLSTKYYVLTQGIANMKILYVTFLFVKIKLNDLYQLSKLKLR